jgi:hypothetical protein
VLQNLTCDRFDEHFGKSSDDEDAEDDSGSKEKGKKRDDSKAEPKKRKHDGPGITHYDNSQCREKI